MNSASGSGSGVPATTWEGKEDPNGPGSLYRVLRSFFKASQSSGTIPDGDKAIQKKKGPRLHHSLNQRLKRRLAHTLCLQSELFWWLKMKFGNCKLSDIGSAQSNREPAKRGGWDVSKCGDKDRGVWAESWHLYSLAGDLGKSFTLRVLWLSPLKTGGK